MKYKTFNVLPEFGTNTYLVWDEISNEAAIIDPAAPSQNLINEIKGMGINLKYLISTHGHGDHIGGNKSINDNFDIKKCIHKDDAGSLVDPNMNLSTYWNSKIIAPKADIILNDGDELTLGNEKMQIIHTPGHSRGGICILIGNLLFCGDTLFADGIGRTDLPGGDYATLIDSIKTKLFLLDGITKVLPGHGPETTIEDEKVGNPFVGFTAR
jgi:hydroxyacylglutathione hydrolase